MKVIITTVGIITPFLVSALSFASPAVSTEKIISIHAVDANGIGRTVGQVTVTETKYGLVFTPALSGLPPGLHGFHVHENPSCQPMEKDGKKIAALAAGGHYDPQRTNRHSTPWGDGHLGDLPPLYVDSNGHAVQPVLTPRLKMSDLSGRALIIHQGGDNHMDKPVALGGGGGRLFCGVSTAAAVTGVPDNLRPANQEKLALTLVGKGVQIYQCQAKKGDSTEFEWLFKAPEAELFDKRSQKVGKHYAGPVWESNDGSTVLGAVQAKAEAQEPNAIPLLLLKAKKVEGNGVFSKVTYIQRLDTSGGTAPKDGCNRTTISKELRVPYSATYNFYTDTQP